jgi:hypothetical protein
VRERKDGSCAWWKEGEKQSASRIFESRRNCLGCDGMGWADLRETSGALNAREEGGDQDGVEGPVC